MIVPGFTVRAAGHVSDQCALSIAGSSGAPSATAPHVHAAPSGANRVFWLISGKQPQAGMTDPQHGIRHSSGTRRRALLPAIERAH